MMHDDPPYRRFLSRFFRGSASFGLRRLWYNWTSVQLDIAISALGLTVPPSLLALADEVIDQQCPLLALSGQSSSTRVCPLLDNSGQSRVLAGEGLSANDPKRTFDVSRVTELTDGGIRVLVGDTSNSHIASNLLSAKSSGTCGQKKKTRDAEIVLRLSPVAPANGVLAMLKLSDPFESELFIGLFYNAETEDSGFRSRREEKKLPEALTRWLSNSERLMRWIIRNVSSYMTRLMRRTEALAQEDGGFHEKHPEALTPECRHLNAPSNETTAPEFRPLTEEEKKEFLNSLDEKGQRILAELEGRNSTIGQSRKPVASVVESGAASIVPDIQTPTELPGTSLTRAK